MEREKWREHPRVCWHMQKLSKVSGLHAILLFFVSFIVLSLSILFVIIDEPRARDNGHFESVFQISTGAATRQYFWLSSTTDRFCLTFSRFCFWFAIAVAAYSRKCFSPSVFWLADSWSVTAIEFPAASSVTAARDRFRPSHSRRTPSAWTAELAAECCVSFCFCACFHCFITPSFLSLLVATNLETDTDTFCFSFCSPNVNALLAASVPDVTMQHAPAPAPAATQQAATQQAQQVAAQLPSKLPFNRRSNLPNNKLLPTNNKRPPNNKLLPPSKLLPPVLR